MTIFLSGNSTIDLNIFSINCTIERAYLDGKTIEFPIHLQLTEKEEKNITLVVKADEPGVLARVIYKISSHGKVYSYNTTIQVSSVNAEEDQKTEEPVDRSLGIIFIISIASITTIYLIYSEYLKKKGREK